jgi:cyclopropane fatty-acyl-phospholipid synthase-like methyltransferase
MVEWYETLDDSMWLRSDHGGEEEATFIAKRLHLRPGNRVLDAPCGAGRLAFPLAEMGFDVVGVDLRKSFVSRARRRFQRAG